MFLFATQQLILICEISGGWRIFVCTLWVRLLDVHVHSPIVFCQEIRCHIYNIIIFHLFCSGIKAANDSSWSSPSPERCLHCPSGTMGKVICTVSSTHLCFCLDFSCSVTRKWVFISPGQVSMWCILSFWITSLFTSARTMSKFNLFDPEHR